MCMPVAARGISSSSSHPDQIMNLTTMRLRSGLIVQSKRTELLLVNCKIGLLNIATHFHFYSRLRWLFLSLRSQTNTSTWVCPLNDLQHIGYRWPPAPLREPTRSYGCPQSKSKMRASGPPPSPASLPGQAAGKDRFLFVSLLNV